MIMLDREEVVMVKGKRSKRSRPDSPPAAASSSTTGGVASDDVVSGGCERVSLHLSSSNSVDYCRGGEDEDMANCLILLAKGQGERSPPPPLSSSAGGVYQCKTCSKSFPSFQALGGHRASHTKPIKEEKKPLTDKHERLVLLPNYDESTILSLQIPSGKTTSSRVHECSICGAEFSSGQALGGHMRRHRPIPTASAAAQEGKKPRNLLSLDLNLPAPEDHGGDQRESKFPFAAKQQVIVFSAASPMVDCHY